MPFPSLPMAKEVGTRFVCEIASIPAYDVDPVLVGYHHIHTTYLEWELTEAELLELEAYAGDAHDYDYITAPPIIWDNLDILVEDPEGEVTVPIIETHSVRLIIPPTRQLLKGGTYRVHITAVLDTL